MDLTEHQGKKLYRQYNLPVAIGVAVSTKPDALAAFRHLKKENPKLKKVVLKAQVPIGHRGQQGAILFATEKDLASQVDKLLGQDFDGHIVNQILIEEFVAIERELYLALSLDRQAREISLLFSKEGGMEIEELVKTGGLVRLSLPLDNAEWARLKEDFLPAVHDQIEVIIKKLEKLMHASDATLVEVNPLALTKKDKLMLLDSKVVIDDNALFRQEELAEFRTKKSGTEQLAQEKGLAFVPLAGNIAVIGNGAGLVMASLDLLKQAGGKPANFLDVGGGARQGVMEDALNIVLQQPHVKGLFVNIFGGITRADEIANGLVAYLDKKLIKVPIVVRLIGNNEQAGKQILQEAGIDALDSMEEAAKLIVSKV